MVKVTHKEQIWEVEITLKFEVPIPFEKEVPIQKERDKLLNRMIKFSLQERNILVREAKSFLISELNK